MNIKITYPLMLSLALATTGLFANQAVAESDSVRQMAQIVIQLNHRPSTADRVTLNNIVKQGSEAERDIAQALLNMDHKVARSDKAKLKEISNNSSLSQNTRDLAMIIHDLNHTASSADKRKLEGM